MPKTIITVHMLALVFLTLAACNSKPSSEHASGTAVQASSGAPARSNLPDPCKILSKAEVESVLGHVDDMQLRDDGSDLKDCYYAVAVPQDAKSEVFMIRITNNAKNEGGVIQAKDLWTLWKKGSESGTTKPIPVAGVGDDAYFSPDGSINVLTGQIILAIGAQGNHPSGPDGVKDINEKSLALARKIVATVR